MNATTWKARLVQRIEGEWITTEFGDTADLIAAMEVRGYAFAGLNRNPRQRGELQGVPKFSGLLGPMWDGDRVRYETAEVYDILSR